MNFQLDDDKNYHARLGLIVLEQDETLETEVRQAINKNIALYHSRIPSRPYVTREALVEMKENLPQAARLLPRHNDLDVVGYGCTSGSVCIGVDVIKQIIATEHKNSRVTNPLSAIIEGLRVLGCNKIGFFSPYIASVSDLMRAALEKHGISIASFASFEQKDEHIVSRISQRDTLEAILNLGAEDNQAIVVSCTNLQSFDIIDEAEQRLGKSVISSNQALIWHMLRLAGVKPEQTKGPGKLFTH